MKICCGVGGRKNRPRAPFRSSAKKSATQKVDNMKSFLKIPIFALAAAIFGCTGVSTTENASAPRVANIDARQTRQIVATNYGYYLFNWIPIFSGGEDENSFAMFSDNVNLAAAMHTFNKKCRELNVEKVCDIQTDGNSTCYFSWIPYFGTTFGLYWYKEIQVSAVVAQAENKADNANKEGK